MEMSKMVEEKLFKVWVVVKWNMFYFWFRIVRVVDLYLIIFFVLYDKDDIIVINVEMVVI